MEFQFLREILLRKPLETMEEINLLACICLEDDEVDMAHELFQKNYLKNPCLQTINNLAYFYLYFGEKNGSRRETMPSKTAEILNGIEKYDGNLFYSYSLLGHAFYRIKDFEKSLIYFEKALEHHKSISSTLNYAFLLYVNGHISKAKEFFCCAYLKDNSNVYSYYCYLFCELLFDSKVDIYNEISYLYRKQKNLDISELDIIDVCKLIFLSKNYEQTILLYNEAFDKYVINPLDFHIIAYSLHRLNLDNQIELYYQRIFDDYKSNYKQPLDNKIEELNYIYTNRMYLKKPKFDLEIKLENDCYLFGCIVHDQQFYKGKSQR